MDWNRSHHRCIDPRTHRGIQTDRPTTHDSREIPAMERTTRTIRGSSRDRSSGSGSLLRWSKGSIRDLVRQGHNGHRVPRRTGIPDLADMAPCRHPLRLASHASPRIRRQCDYRIGCKRRHIRGLRAVRRCGAGRNSTAAVICDLVHPDGLQIHGMIPIGAWEERDVAVGELRTGAPQHLCSVFTGGHVKLPFQSDIATG